MDPTPVATYGKDPKIAESVREKLLPDFEGERELPIIHPRGHDHRLCLCSFPVLHHITQTLHRLPNVHITGIHHTIRHVTS